MRRYQEPQAWHWYHDATRHHPSPDPIVNDAVLEPILASLRALQSQFTAFQEGLDSVKSDVHDVLSQLQTLPTAQNKADRSAAKLEDVISVSSTGTPARERRKQGRGRGSKTKAPPEVDGAETAPENTLIASIQSAVDAFLPPDNHASDSQLQMVPTPPPVTPFVGLSARRVSGSSSPSSTVDPSPLMQSMQFAFPVSSLSQETCSPVSSIAIPTLAFPPPTSPAKEYPEASIQVCPIPTPESSGSLSNSHGNAPGFVPVDSSSNLAALGCFASYPLRPTAFTAEYLSRLLPNTSPNASNTTTDSRTLQGDDGDHHLRSSIVSATLLSTGATLADASTSYPIDPSTRIQRVDSTLLPSAASSLDTSTPPSAGGAKSVDAPHSSTNMRQGAEPPSLTADGADSSVVPRQIGPTGDWTTQLASSSGIIPDAQMPSSAVNISGRTERLPSVTMENADTSTQPETRPAAVSDRSSTSPSNPVDPRDMQISDAGPSGHEHHPVQPHTESNPNDTQMTSDAESDAITITRVAKAIPESKPTATKTSRRSSPCEADDDRLPSGLPTPPSESVTDSELRLVSRPMRDVDSRLISPTHTHLSDNFSISTPSLRTPELTAVGDRGILSGVGRRSLGVVSESTSPVFSPSSAVGGSLAEQRVRDAEEYTDSSDDAARAVVHGENAVVRFPVDAWIDGARSSPRTDQADVDAPTCSTPVITIMKAPETTTASNEDATQVPDVGEDADVSRTPRLAVNQTNTGSPAHDPDVTVNDTDSTYSPSHACETGYDFHFSSPCRPALDSPPTSAAPSRYATPSESSSTRQTLAQDEAEVWDVLMVPGKSGVSTPLSGSGSTLGMMFSYPASRAVSVPSEDEDADTLTVDPSMLQSHGSSVPERGEDSLRMSNGSLSPLTSLGEVSDVDKQVDVDNPARRMNDTRTPIPAPAFAIPTTSFKSSGRSHTTNLRDCHSEPFRAPPSRASDASVSAGATSEGTGIARLVGGPGASLEELLLLARKAPLKISLRVPQEMRGVKRKRDTDISANGNGDDGRAEREIMSDRGSNDVADGVRVGRGDKAMNRRRRGLGVMSARKGGRTHGASHEVVPPTQIGVEMSTLRLTCTPPLAVAGLAPESSTSSSTVDSRAEQPDVMKSDLSVSRKSTKNESERRRKKCKRELNANSNAAVTWHMRNGRIVRIVSGQNPPSSSVAPARPRAPRLEEAKSNVEVSSPTRSRHRRQSENQMTKTLPPSPAHASPSHVRHAHPVKPPPTKEDAWSAIVRYAATWPDLPSVFSQWDVQFIQCDNCEKWYHYGCAAIQSGDPRLEPSALFICPTCYNQSSRRQTLRRQDETCARPDCPEPQVTADSEVFFIEKLVGRKKCEGYFYMWLAKWEGYPMTQATWIPRENVIGDGTRMMNTFLEEAVEEGADLSQDMVLLQEAREAGWDMSAR